LLTGSSETLSYHTAGSFKSYPQFPEENDSVVVKTKWR